MCESESECECGCEGGFENECEYECRCDRKCIFFSVRVNSVKIRVRVSGGVSVRV